MLRIAIVGAGGMLGSVARYWLGGIVQGWNGTGFPAGTLAVNVLGSFLLGLVITLSIERGMVSAPLRLFLTVGICGGFTTMSTFSYETMVLVSEGGLAAGAGNIAATLILCLAGVWLGTIAGRMV